MNKAANTYWIDSRLATQRPAARVITLPAPTRAFADDAPVVSAPRETSRRGGLSVPSWVFFCMVMLATFGVCVTVTMRTHAEMQTAEQKLHSVSSEVKELSDTNAELRREVKRLRDDPQAIEAAARTRLNMVRANEIVVPVN